MRAHLHEGGTSTGLDDEIVGNQRTHELLEMQLLVGRHQFLEFLLLPMQQPAELFGALRDGERQRLERGIGEQHDHLGPDVERRIVESRIENAERGDLVGMFDREIDRRDAGRIMRDRHDLAEPQSLNHRRQVAELLREAVGCAGRFFGRAKAEEIERDDAPAGLGQVGDEVVIDAKVVGKTVHQNEGRTRAVIIAGVDASLLAGNTMFGESRSAHGVLVEAAFEFEPPHFDAEDHTGSGPLDWIISTLFFCKKMTRCAWGEMPSPQVRSMMPPPPFSRTLAFEFGKDPGEVALVDETAHQSDIGQSEPVSE